MSNERRVVYTALPCPIIPYLLPSNLIPPCPTMSHTNPSCLNLPFPQSLHLGHVAKCFGLRDSPKTIRVHDDTISKIFNGLYSAALFNDKEAKKRARDEKFSLSRGVKKAVQAAKPAQTGGNKWRGGSTDSNVPKTAAATGSVSGGDAGSSSSSSGGGVTAATRPKTLTPTAYASTEERVTNTSKPIPVIIPSDKRKLRLGTKAVTMGSRVLAPSGKFRKSSDGYFKKKLRNQSSSEFSA